MEVIEGAFMAKNADFLGKALRASVVQVHNVVEDTSATCSGLHQQFAVVGVSIVRLDLTSSQGRIAQCIAIPRLMIGYRLTPERLETLLDR